MSSALTTRAPTRRKSRIDCLSLAQQVKKTSKQFAKLKVDQENCRKEYIDVALDQEPESFKTQLRALENLDRKSKVATPKLCKFIIRHKKTSSEVKET